MTLVINIPTSLCYLLINISDSDISIESNLISFNINGEIIYIYLYYYI